MRRIINPLILFVAILMIASCKNQDKIQKINNPLPEWAFGGFIRAEENPVLSPDSTTTFFCPMQKRLVHWEIAETFNPTALVADGKIKVLYRAEDDPTASIGRRTSRIGLAETTDGIHMKRRSEPVFYPDEDGLKKYEWLGGCEDPRIAVTEDGLYVMTYTAVERTDVPVFHAWARLCVATSRDMIHWEKHGSVFEEAYGGKFADLWSKAGSIVTKVVDGRQVIAKVNGRYMMYWGESFVNIAWSDDLINWTPTVDENEELVPVLLPREGYFDGKLVECGPPAVITDDGILLMYNGRNCATGDPRYPENWCCGGQVLFDLQQPNKVIGRLDEPFFIPSAEFEKTGQWEYGAVFIEGLTFYKGKWYMYYGCSDSHVGVAVYDPSVKADGDPLPEEPVKM